MPMVVRKLDIALKGVCPGLFTFYLQDPSSSLNLHLSEMFGVEKGVGNYQVKSI